MSNDETADSLAMRDIKRNLERYNRERVEEQEAKEQEIKAQFELAKMELIVRAQIQEADFKFQYALKQYENNRWKDGESEWWTNKIKSLKDPMITAIQNKPFISKREMEI